jgi:hypothetical protein
MNNRKDKKPKIEQKATPDYSGIERMPCGCEIYMMETTNEEKIVGQKECILHRGITYRR